MGGKYFSHLFIKGCTIQLLYSLLFTLKKYYLIAYFLYCISWLSIPASAQLLGSLCVFVALRYLSLTSFYPQCARTCAYYRTDQDTYHCTFFLNKICSQHINRCYDATLLSFSDKKNSLQFPHVRMQDIAVVDNRCSALDNFIYS